MKAVIAVLLISASAAASPSAMIAPPAGWTPDPEQAATLAQKVQKLKHFGGVPVVVAAEAYVPKQAGVAMFVTRISTEAWTGSLGEAARTAIDDLHESAAKAYDWRELPPDDKKAIVARGEWADTATGTQTVGMVVIAASDKKLVAVRGECLSADKASGDDVNACVQALYSLDPGIPLAERVTFAAAPAGTAAPEPQAGLKLPDQARLTDGQDIHLAPITVSQPKPEQDRRPIYLGAGIVILAAVFWWNRRQREKFERGDAPRDDKPARRSRDDDADDLAAAARGDEPDPGSKDDQA